MPYGIPFGSQRFVVLKYVIEYVKWSIQLWHKGPTLEYIKQQWPWIAVRALWDEEALVAY
jgi:hypothetical protein